MKKLFIKTSTMNRKIREAELNIIKRLEEYSLDPVLIDTVVSIIADELDSIIQNN